MWGLCHKPLKYPDPFVKQPGLYGFAVYHVVSTEGVVETSSLVSSPIRVWVAQFRIWMFQKIGLFKKKTQVIH